MRVIIILLGLIAFLAWAGFELKDRQRDVSQILLVLAILLTLVLFGALFGLYGN
ncbi:MAG: hypothetical protein ACFCVA_15155 [Gammaproteobacteria bacterium]